MSTAVSPVASSTMASASAVPPSSNTFANSFHNLTNHVILSSPNREDVNLTLSPSSSFLSSYSSVCSNNNTSRSTIPPNTFATSKFPFSSDTKENDSCTTTTISSMNRGAEAEVREQTVVDSDGDESLITNCKPPLLISNCGDEPQGLPTADDFKEDTIQQDAIKPVLIQSKVSQEFEDSSNSNSTQSSDIANGSARKKRRRGEDQILMEDLFGIDKSLASGIVSHLKSSSPSSNATGPSTNEVEDDISNQGEGGELKKSKEDSPAFHLRPRRSHKTSYSGCSSGSQSPIFFLSPVKRNKQPLVRKSISNYTNRLLSDSCKQLNLYLNDKHSHSIPAIASTSKSCSILLKEDCHSAPPPKAASCRRVRSYDSSVKRDVDVSVFAEMISPLKITYNTFYDFNYIAMQIVDMKPLRYANLLHPTSKEKLYCPLLELVTVDLNDRFLLTHTIGVFDDPSITEASDKRLTIYLLGTYALKSSQLGAKGQVVNLINFRTTKLAKNDQPLQPPKKRKLVTSPKTKSANSDDETESYAFQVIVDAMDDIATFKEDLKPSLNGIKAEFSDNEVVTLEQENLQGNDCFDEIYCNSPPEGEPSQSNWRPLVSFSHKWRAPEDPKELNKSLYVQQPCIPKFESASRTVKM